MNIINRRQNSFFSYEHPVEGTNRDNSSAGKPLHQVQRNREVECHKASNVTTPTDYKIDCISNTHQTKIENKKRLKLYKIVAAIKNIFILIFTQLKKIINLINGDQIKKRDKTILDLIKIQETIEKIHNKIPINEVEKNDFSQKLESIIETKNIKNTLNDYMKINDDFICAINKETLEFVIKIKDISDKQKTCIKAHQKGIELINILKNNQSILPKNRLSLEETGTIYWLSTFDDKLQSYKDIIQHSELKKSKEFSELFNSINSAYQISETIYSTVIGDYNRLYQDGDLLTLNLVHVKKWTRQPLISHDALRILVSNNHGHASKVYKKNDQVKISHVVAEHQHDELYYRDLLLNDIWRINLEPLLSPHMKTFLDGQIDDIHQMFIQVENEILSNHYIIENYDNITNHFAKSIFQEIIDPRKTLNISEIAQQFKDNNFKTPLLCSEFTAYTTLIALDILNKNLASIYLTSNPEYSFQNILETVDEEGISIGQTTREYLQKSVYFSGNINQEKKKIVKLLKRLGYKTAEIEIIMKLNNLQVFNLPISKQQKIITPGGLISLLKKKGCIQKVPHPESATQLINF